MVLGSMNRRRRGSSLLVVGVATSLISLATSVSAQDATTQLPAGTSGLGVSITGGTIVPDIETLKKFVADLRAELAADPDLKTVFDAYPDQVLADRGLSKVLRRELLKDLGVETGATAEGCLCSVCCVTIIAAL